MANMVGNGIQAHHQQTESLLTCSTGPGVRREGGALPAQEGAPGGGRWRRALEREDEARGVVFFFVLVQVLGAVYA